MNLLIGFAIGITLLLVGLGNLNYTWRRRRMKTIGTIVSSQVERVGESELYKLDLKYAYRVNGRPFEGSVIDMRVLNPHGAEKLAVSYPQGKNFELFYDSKNPESSSLEQAKGGYLGDVGIAAGGLLVIAVMIFLEVED